MTRDAPAVEQTSAEAPRDLPVGFDRVVLVCRQCQKRGSGPAKLKSKAVIAELKAGVRRVGVRTRVASTGCLGPCPKRAITVVAPEGSVPRAVAWAVASKAEARALGAVLGREAEAASRGAAAGRAAAVPAIDPVDPVDLVDP